MANNNNWINGEKWNEMHPDASASCCGASFYEIRVKGQLNDDWSEWLEGLNMKLLENGEMVLFGPIVDQAALMGVLNKLSRLNLTLLSVNEMSSNIQQETK